MKNRKYLTDALDITPEFLRTKHGDAGELSFTISRVPIHKVPMLQALLLITVTGTSHLGDASVL